MKKWLLAAVAACFAVTAWAQEAPRYEEGVQYERIARPVPTTTGDKIEVVEMFGYLCPHCNSFEPLLESWTAKQPADVQLVTIPVVFGRSWEPLARAFYVAELLGKVDETHKPMFDAIHKERRNMRSADDLADFYADYGVEPDNFRKQYESFAVNMKLKQGDAKARGYEITGVPTLIVNGKYRITAGSAGGHEQMLKVADYLIEQERQGN
ncbi:thiol:disulfide interchange protein DsbA/DsbL [Marinobacterium sp. D7]|uniref:thiol:disulfide interchange protein DsbA/DsbL n=1 Tax=Marinobacterium ramblicola TaxID=2849041 RepID=UPI001C2D8324|nr:thiol:disulfide interchange protein DsbA/DsbL [Marinobacterium ramblicola]MBV1789243.1 thiol:disulfide interchange protein DsbA/DsbL [Marinobacterium ramblicola]